MGIETLVVTLLGTALVTLALMFLPALIELRNPKDAGPRIISDIMPTISVVPIVNIEEEPQNNDVFILGTLNFIGTIPSLEL